MLDFIKGKEVIEICPEMLSGLGAPRKSVELVKGRVQSRDGEDFTRDFENGVKRRWMPSKMKRSNWPFYSPGVRAVV